uniref:Uncharacterized protein n=1 Tax=Acrobeloides nanus TaxID=290746 RepID=A0A914E0Y1_9BILA
MDTLRLELKPWGIKCSIVEPGSFKTPLAIRPGFWIGLIEKTWNNLSKDQKEEYGEEFKDDLISMRTTGVQTYPENFDYVVDNYFHAVTARYPRSRYQCGWDAIFYFIPLSLVFPTELQDWIHTRMRGKLMKTLPAVFQKLKKD